MADPVWGLLQKSAVDNETIEQAIVRLIIAHNNDETAHLDTGQSLQSHKASEIIDHLAGSVKNDKFSFNTFFYDLKFSDYSLWSKYKTGSVYSFSQSDTQVTFETYPSGAAGYNRLYKSFSNDPNSLSSYFISSKILTEGDPHSSVYWSFGLFNGSLAVNKVSGFKFTGGKLYCSLHNFSSNAEMNHELVGVNVFDNVEHSLRMSYDATTKIYAWYIDGLFVYSYDNSADGFPSPWLPSLGGFDFNFTYDVDYDFVVHNYDFVESVDSTY